MHNKKIQPVVLAVIQHDGKFLLTLRSEHERGEKDLAGMWQLPGGGVDFSESLEDALLRECREEVGLDVRIESLIPYIQSSVRGNWHGVFIAYSCSLVDQQQTIVLNEEATEYGWYSDKEIHALKILPINYRILKHIMTA